MDVLAFIAAVVDSLAWPVVTVVLVLLLRKPIRRLIPLLNRFKYRELELQFGRRVEEIGAEVLKTVPEAAVKAGAAATESRARTLAGVSPRAAIIDAWSALERTLMVETERRGMRVTDEHGNVKLIRALSELEKENVIADVAAEIILELKELRNDAVHLDEVRVTEEIAKEYGKAAMMMMGHVSGQWE